MSNVSNLPNIPSDPTTKYFNNFFVTPPSTSPNTNDAITSYFTTITGDPTSGSVLAASVLLTANQQNMDPMLVLDQFRKMSPGDLNAYLTIFLNANRAGTSLIGINNQPQSSPYTIRTILA